MGKIGKRLETIRKNIEANRVEEMNLVRFWLVYGKHDRKRIKEKETKIGFIAKTKIGSR